MIYINIIFFMLFIYFLEDMDNDDDEGDNMFLH